MTTTRGWVDTIDLESKHLPRNWQKRLFSEGKVGGVMFIFIEGESRGVIKTKVDKIKDFCKTLKEISL